MKRFVVFPNLTVSPAQRPNPYIQDYIEALNRLPDVRVINPAHKNPLLSLLPPSRWGDVFIFNRYGFLAASAHQRKKDSVDAAQQKAACTRA